MQNRPCSLDSFTAVLSPERYWLGPCSQKLCGGGDGEVVRGGGRGGGGGGGGGGEEEGGEG